MKNNISLEYAEALFLLACECSQSQEYLSDLGIVKSLIQAEPEYLSLLRSPNISREEKEALIDGALGGRVKEHIVSFLKLLCEKNRADLLPLCIENYEKLHNQINKVVVARVTSAVELTLDERERLIKSLERKTGHKVELICQVDKSILGGIIVKTEDTVLDGSLKRKIHDVKEVIKSEPKA